MQNNTSNYRRKLREIIAFLIASFAILSFPISAQLGFGVNLLYLASPLLLVLVLSFYKSLPAGSTPLWCYIFFSYWNAIVFLSLLFGHSFAPLIQTSIYFFVPLTLILLGYFERNEVIYNALVFSSLAICVFAVIERLVFFSVVSSEFVTLFSMKLRGFGLDDQDILHLGRATGLFGNPNDLGLFSAACFFAISYTRSKTNNNILYWTVNILLLLALLLSSSRGSLVAILLVIIVLLPDFIRSKKGWGIIFTLLGGTVLIMVLGGMFLEDYFQTLLGRQNMIIGATVDANLLGRIRFWTDFFASDYLIFGTISSPESVLGHALDNMFIRLWAQGGLIGLFLAVGIFISLFLRNHLIESRHLRFLAHGFVLVFLINAQTTLGFLSAGGIGVFWLMVGVLVKDTRQGAR